MPAAVRTLLEKIAVDNGFDRELAGTSGWLAFASTQSPLEIWLTVEPDGSFALALSRANVAAALRPAGAEETPLPKGAVAALSAPDLATLHHVVRRAFQLAKTLPHELLRTFETETRHLPRSTEAERLVIQRVGQNLFREGLLTYWQGRCAITGLAVPELLRASHIKPWAACATDGERLDVYNGLLLAPHLDAAFDQGFITIEDDGVVVVSDELDNDAMTLLRLTSLVVRQRLESGHRHYLQWHRRSAFRRGNSPAS